MRKAERYLNKSKEIKHNQFKTIKFDGATKPELFLIFVNSNRKLASSTAHVFLTWNYLFASHFGTGWSHLLENS